MKKVMLIIFSLIVFLAVAISPDMEQQSIKVFALNGNGTKEKPFMINSIADWDIFRDNTFGEGKYVKLNTDLDLGATRGTSSFKGIFDGGNHTLYNLVNLSPIDGNWGIFGGTLNSPAVIKNLHIRNVNITKKSGPLGIFGSNAYGATFENVTIKGGKLTGAANTGAFFGYGNATLKNCAVEIDIFNETDGNTGGFAGQLNTSMIIENSYFKGVISGSTNVGGFIGNSSNNTQIINSFTEGMLNAVNSSNVDIYAGGLVGRGNAIIQNCYSKMEVRAHSDGNPSNIFVGGLTANSSSNNSNSVVLNPVLSATSASAATNLRVAPFGTVGATASNNRLANGCVRNDISMTETRGAAELLIPNVVFHDYEYFETHALEVFSDVLEWDFAEVWEIGVDGLPQLRITPPFLAYSKEPVQNLIDWYYLNRTFWTQETFEEFESHLIAAELFLSDPYSVTKETVLSEFNKIQSAAEEILVQNSSANNNGDEPTDPWLKTTLAITNGILAVITLSLLLVKLLDKKKR